MGINKKIVSVRKDVPWNGDVAVSVKGLTPNDLAKLLVFAGDDMAGVVGIADDLDGLKHQVTGLEADAVAEVLVKQVPQIIAAFGKHFPELLARIIAVASEDEGEWKFVLEEFNVGLQFECLKTIAELSFNGPDGFRVFVGNVLGLLDVGRSLTEKNPMPRARKPSARGSRMSTN